MIFASLEIETDPPKWDDFFTILQTWVQDAGIMAAVAFTLVAIHFLTERRKELQGQLSALTQVVIGCGVLSLLAYLGFALMLASYGMVVVQEKVYDRIVTQYLLTPMQSTLLTIAGFCAILAVTLPMFVQLFPSLSWRRTWALAQLSIKEAIRGRVILIFCIMAVVFLFADWFVTYKPENQLRNYVAVVYWSLSPLFLVTAALLGSFSIPADVRKQTIHTIVTKPVQKYEIVLGRFLGYGLLLTVALAILSGLSLLYVLRGINPKAQEESYKARVPVFADRLRFSGTNDPKEAQSVGREWDYRKYIQGRIRGSNETKQYAIWMFDDLPSLADPTKPVRFEFTFDIFRTTKGIEDEGVVAHVLFAAGNLSPKKAEDRWQQFKKNLGFKKQEIDRYYQGAYERGKALSVKSQKDERERGQALLAEVAAAKERDLKYERAKLEMDLGVFAVSKMVTDYHTQHVEVPSGMFEYFEQNSEKIRKNPLKMAGWEEQPLFTVLVSLDENPAYSQQRLGVARHDLYLLADEYSFEQNFLKGIFGLWCNTMLLLGIAVACSTYMSGIISLLITIFMMCAGWVVEYIKSVATGTAVGGGPLEAFQRMRTKSPMTSKLEENAANTMVLAVDEVYRWFLVFVLKTIPDETRYNLTQYVADGFNISLTQHLFLDNFLPLLGYLLPWGVLAYYLMNSREIANPR